MAFTALPKARRPLQLAHWPAFRERQLYARTYGQSERQNKWKRLRESTGEQQVSTGEQQASNGCVAREERFWHLNRVCFGCSLPGYSCAGSWLHLVSMKRLLARAGNHRLGFQQLPSHPTLGTKIAGYSRPIFVITPDEMFRTDSPNLGSGSTRNLPLDLLPRRK